MAVYDLVLDGDVVRTLDFGDETPPDLSAHPHKGIWLPHVTVNETITAAPYQTIEIARQIGTGDVTYTYSVSDITGSTFDTLRRLKLDAVSAQFHTHDEAPISYAVAGVTKQWDADPGAVQNLTMVALAIATGVPMPDPRPWTAYQESEPTSVSLTDLKNILVAIGQRRDALFVVKKTKEAEITALTSAADLWNYDTTTGWS